jgi:hypothetical protein
VRILFKKKAQDLCHESSFGVLLLAKFCGEQFSNADNGSGAAHAERSKKILSIVLMCGRA